MKKAHLGLLVITLFMASFSAYSLAAMSSVSPVEFERFPKIGHSVKTQGSEHVPKEAIAVEGIPEFRAHLIGNQSEGGRLDDVGIKFSQSDYKKYLFLYCYTDVLYKHRVQVLEIAKRDHLVEVKVLISEKGSIKEGNSQYNGYDVVHMDKSYFPKQEEIEFVFKDQNGRTLYKQLYMVE